MDSTQEIKELFGKREPLDPELEAYFTSAEENPNGWPCIQHPLVYSVIHTPEMNATMNRALRAKQEAIREHRRKGEWASVVWVHERPYRLQAFDSVADKLGDETYWDLLGTLWTDSENIWQNEDEWVWALSSDRPGRENLMEKWERERLAALPEQITVYRGYQQDHRIDGMSWTLDEQRATWFAKRLWIPDKGGAPMVAEGTVAHKDVLAFFGGRSEDEIVTLPNTVTVKEVTEIDPD